MKTLFVFLFCFLGLYAQDSTEIKFNDVEDDALQLANSLNNIQMITIECDDTTMRGRTFKLITREYEEGELVKTDDYGLNCEDKQDSFEINGQKYIHTVNFCDQIRFRKDEESYKIRLALKQKEEECDMLIRYGGLIFEPKYKSTPGFDLRIALEKSNGKYIVPIGKEIPILTFNPPYEIEGGDMLYYCILDTENPGSWYEKYNIERYYVISLLIE